ncbi:MAG TPA: Stp1/IreP family PP2C-type Ser/Thr phosphatase, partial [Acidimicrobiales bacterium]|nr:Stp1/IreP family PP2C-type Ser/Thr phosphatase [Acidimicrobiales bacterium]
MELAAGGATDVGMVRSANQDSWLIADRLWAVADGMGGHQGGEVASQVTIEVLGEHFDEFTSEALVSAAFDANTAVHTRASQHAELRGMGTTLCALALVDTDDGKQALSIINVGDSRCYRWRDGEMTQITRDHSLVEDMRAAGQITDAEAAVHPHRNIVTRALGIQPEVKVDTFAAVPTAGDRYVLCSDGLFNEVTVDRIAATLRRLADPQEAALELIRQANESGGRDNVTCVVVDVIDDAGAAAAVGADSEPGTATSPAPARQPDLAGITTAQPAVDVESPPEKAPSRRRRRDRTTSEPRLRRATWRSLIFAVVLLAILGVATLAVGWYARGSYFVGLDDGEVTIYKGRPQQVLWFEPTVSSHTGISEAQVPAPLLDAVSAGKQQSTSSDAHAYVARMRSMICTELRNGAAPSPSRPGAPTTTIPSACRDLATAPTTTSKPTTTAGATTTTVAPTTS